MNRIFIGKIPVELPKGGLLFVHDEIPTIPRARVFDPLKHSFNPIKDINYRKANDIVDIFDALFSRGDSTLTKDTGLDVLANALETATSLETLIPEPDKRATTGDIWAYGKVQRLLRSPVLKNVFCKPTNFSFNPRSIILARVNRAELGDFDARVLTYFLIRQFQGQVVIPDFGFYGRDTHMSLIRENRLIAGVRSLKRLPEALRDEVLQVEDKVIRGALYDDAVELAKEAGKYRDPDRRDNDFNQFVERAIEPIDS